MKLLESCNEAKRNQAPKFGGFPCNKIIILGEALAKQTLNKTDAFRVTSHSRTGNSPLGAGSFPTEVNKRRKEETGLKIFPCWERKKQD